MMKHYMIRNLWKNSYIDNAVYQEYTVCANKLSLYIYLTDNNNIIIIVPKCFFFRFESGLINIRWNDFSIKKKECFVIIQNCVDYSDSFSFLSSSQHFIANGQWNNNIASYFEWYIKKKN